MVGAITKSQFGLIKCYIWFFVIFWTVVVGISMVWSVQISKKNTLNHLRIQAQAMIEKDEVYRRWIADAGGVYIPISAKIQPNPHLSSVPERDITTPSQKKLTLIDPEYMSRLVYEIERKQEGIKIHIASLNPIHPDHKPDEWEKTALEKLKKGDEEITGIETINGKDYFRLIELLEIEEPCLKCHSDQGYKIGDTLGGISVSIPMKIHAGFKRNIVMKEVATHIIIWLLGLGIIISGTVRIRRDIRKREEAEAKIRLQNEFMHNVFESIDQPFFVLNACDYSFQFFNSNTVETFGDIPKDAKCFEYIYKRIMPCEKMGLPCIIKEGEKIKKSIKIERIIKDKNGETRFYEVHGYPILDDAGNLTQIISYMVDITDRKRIEEEMNRIKTGIEHTFASFTITDALGNIQYVNPAFEKLRGYPASEVIGQHISILKNNESDFYTIEGNIFRDRTVWQGELTYKKKNGEVFNGETIITLVKNKKGEVTNFVSMTRDITEKKKLENKIRKLQREYEAFMRHEIKNLIAPLKGYAELILYKFHEGMNEKQLHYVVKMKENIDRINNLIDYLKKLQDFEIGQYELNKINYDLKQLVNRIIEDLSILAREHNVRIEYNSSVTNSTVCLDVNLIPGVFVNLIKNAIEHVADLEWDPEKTVQVVMFNENGKIVVKINNRGEPIPPEKLELFFEKFNSNRTKKKEGTGLGTTYAYLVTKAHGGDITVESNEKDGTTVTVLFNVC